MNDWLITLILFISFCMVVYATGGGNGASYHGDYFG
jgi:hypothetical protein